MVLALDPVQRYLSVALALQGQPHLHIHLANPGAEAVAYFAPRWSSRGRHSGLCYQGS